MLPAENWADVVAFFGFPDLSSVILVDRQLSRLVAKHFTTIRTWKISTLGFVSHADVASSMGIVSYVTDPNFDGETQMIPRAALSEALPIVLTNCILDSLNLLCACHERKEFCYSKMVLRCANRLLVTNKVVAHLCCFENDDSAVDFISRLWVIKVCQVLERQHEGKVGYLIVLDPHGGGRYLEGPRQNCRYPTVLLLRSSFIN